VENTKSTFENCEAIKKHKCNMGEEGFACGPFLGPPFGSFRVNCLMPLPQRLKVRTDRNA
jgi:hypothetical protein